MTSKQDRNKPAARKKAYQRKNGPPPAGVLPGYFHAYLPNSFRKAEREKDPGQFLARLIKASPVPPAVLINLAGECDFKGLDLLGEAAALQVRPDTLHDRDDADRGRKTGTSSIGLDQALELLSERLGEVREGQIEMAHIVLQAMQGGEIALVEAGTGTGKSLAYLLPAVLHATSTGERVIISTHTRNLQDQLLTGEMAKIREILGTSINVERLFGRENYICSKRLSALIARRSADDPRAAFDLALSASLCESGLTADLSPMAGLERRGDISAPSRCLMKGCSHGSFCPLLLARNRAKAAPVVFVNHALILTDYSQGNSILGSYENVVFDEAHHLEKSVIENLSVTVSRSDIGRIFEQVAPLSVSNDKWRLLAGELEGRGDSFSWRKHFDGAGAALDRLEESYGKFMAGLDTSLKHERRERATRTRYLDGAEAFAGAASEKRDFLLNINILRDMFKPLLEADVSQAGQQIRQELRYVDEDLAALADATIYLTEASDEESVFWLEWTRSDTVSRICGSPLDIGRRFADFLEESCTSAVFTSATLAQNGSFEYIRDRLGMRFLPSEPLELVADSPFSFRENCLIIMQSGLGDPNSPAYGEEAGRIVEKLALETGRRMMVLLTSYRMCRAVRKYLLDAGIESPLFVQDPGESREALAAEFRGRDNAILLGVASFWEGVDFPGDQLEILVIPKLPFPVPTEPIVQARSDRLRQLGDNPFTSLHLPIAIMRLRQGVGRLIRRKEDRGVVVLLDSRLGSKPYASKILGALPSEVMMTESAGETVDLAAGWFAGGRESAGSVKRNDPFNVDMEEKRM